MAKNNSKAAEEIKAPETFHELKAIAEEWKLEIPLKAPFTPDKIDELIPLLRLPLPDNTIREAKKEQTGKGYDSTSYSYQAHVDRMNWVFGLSNWRYVIQNEKFDDTKQSKYGRRIYEWSGEVVIEIGYKTLNEETKAFDWILVHTTPAMPTDHESMENGSARKGMHTKGIKRGTSLLGVGADAYLGLLDDDLVTGIEPGDQMAGQSTPTQRQRNESSQAWEDQNVTEQEYNALVKMAKGKGLDHQGLRRWYNRKSEGAIDKDPTTLTKGEASQVRKWLADYQPQQDAPEKAQDGRSEDPTSKQSDQGPKTQEPASHEAEGGNPGQAMPRNLTELMAMPEDRIRAIAADHSFKVPDKLTATNIGPLCKTLAQLMGIPLQ